VQNEALAQEIAFWDYPSPISLELEEGVVLTDESIGFTRSLKALRDAGVHLVVDKFGSGTASLVALRRVAPDAVKIDARLIDPIAQQGPARALVQSIIAVGRAQGMQVTASGVETKEQAKVLTELGCTRAQGFAFTHPLTFDEIMTGGRNGEGKLTA